MDIGTVHENPVLHLALVKGQKAGGCLCLKNQLLG